jgi:putative membrane protein
VATVSLVAKLASLSPFRYYRHLVKTVEAGCHRRADHVLSDNMIRNFSDHSANERTFLAWVRTAIAVMAFGFLVEKFDLFLEVAAPSLAGRTLSLPGQKFGNLAGLALIVLGTAMVGIAAVRFVRTAKNIDQKELRPGTGSRIDIALAGLLVLLGCALFFYLSHAIVMKL